MCLLLTRGKKNKMPESRRIKSPFDASGSDSELNEQRLSPGGGWQGAVAQVPHSCEARSWHFGEKNTDLEGSPAPAPSACKAGLVAPPPAGEGARWRAGSRECHGSCEEMQGWGWGGARRPETTQQAAGTEERSKPPAARRPRRPGHPAEEPNAKRRSRKAETAS